ncbi:MAG: bifunctional phosphopantothenoylcysteine decarboxylase/phosphopantothenate--cysteine ligase CoaBC [Bacteroidia bacterium]|jgi:phosphopantothenoylcysteine decarboxylase/phosphopantothenate--cysteine ligase|nr:bifunctional phosphopantothenoylcysteine decarboxylase/phosphopantothenate--cysteine ligase CoaBC [Bacteroidia bacterium]
MLFQKKIVLGITGSIAAYKSVLLARLLARAGAEVKVVITASARDFVTPLSLSTLTKNQVFSSFTTGEDGEWVNHVELGMWADLILIAPASANTIGSCANGLCHNLLQAVYLSARCPVFFAPAMDLDMWKHIAVQANIGKLRSYGNYIIDPGTGELASGLVGEGRMAEPETILEIIEDFFSMGRQMNGRRVLVTAGPTREAIDPVRFISNYSSGKMGFSIAEELANRGATVSLISGPVDIRPTHPGISWIKVNSAEEMLKAAEQEFQKSDAAILCAAVADFQPTKYEEQKIKKEGEQPHTIELKKTPDILAKLGQIKSESQILAGFALETNSGRDNAMKKLKNKNLDFIVLNQLSETNQIFGSDQNQIEILDSKGEWKTFAQNSKAMLAKDIADQLNSCFTNA